MNGYTALAVPVQNSDEVQTNASNSNDVYVTEAYVVPASDVKKGEGQDRESIEFLKERGFTEGLSKALLENVQISSRYTWLLDNSGSMLQPDGNRIINNGDRYRILECTRWKELEQCIDFQIDLAANLAAPTTFRLLNNPGPAIAPQKFCVGATGHGNLPQEARAAKNMIKKIMPEGSTPLTEQLNQIKSEIEILEPQLLEQGKKFVIVLATDGLPTNEYGDEGNEATTKFVQALQSLEEHPIWIVFRLCTSDENVVHFYNNIDKHLEQPIEVLRDYLHEAEEVYKCNPWLNYTLPLHRCREMGFHHRILDLIDERLLNIDEIVDFCKVIFGDLSDIPNAQEDWMGFLQGLNQICKRERRHWNPIKMDRMHWVDVQELDKIHGSGVRLSSRMLTTGDQAENSCKCVVM